MEIAQCFSSHYNSAGECQFRVNGSPRIGWLILEASVLQRLTVSWAPVPSLLPHSPATAPSCPFLPLPSALTRPSWHAGASWAARVLEVAATHFGTEGGTGVPDLGLAPIASEARGAGAEEAGGHGRGGARGAGKGGKKGVAAASVLAGLGILAGVRKLACLTQEARGTPGRGGERKVHILTLCSHLPPFFAFICFFSSSSPPSFLLSSHSPHPLPCSPSLSPTPMRCTHWQVPCPWDRLRQVPPLAQGSGKLPHCSPRDGDEGEMGAGSIGLHLPSFGCSGGTCLQQPKKVLHTTITFTPLF